MELLTWISPPINRSLLEEQEEVTHVTKNFYKFPPHFYSRGTQHQGEN